ncbi:MAG: hypothetical protein J5955_04325 [Bacilli bacterium]|nr:hypothetical protein [Bacilli bacterium]
MFNFYCTRKAFSSPSLCEQNNDEKTECESIKDIDLKISDLRNQLDKYANYNDDAFLSLKAELKKAIKELENKKLILENGRLINLNPEIRAKQILNELEQLPTCDDIGDYNFRTLFKDLIVINRDRLTFVIGSDDLSTLPLNPNKIPMKYICEYKYKMRSARSTCYFGIYINK